ncbi:MAG: HNH endonuclease [Candidatus Eisenbacteria bacterium]|nr:HNH endonuclease [Candidatus Eisenbacteria bacterium]
MPATKSEGNQVPTTLSDDDLIIRADEVARTEHDTSLSLLDLLLEMDRRSIHLSLGYSSLFDYCTRRWLFSRAKAGRYIAVARAMRKFPGLRSLLDQRQLTIGNAAQVVGILSRENAREILARVSGRTYREIEEIAAAYRDAKPVREVLRPIGIGGRKTPRHSGSASSGDLLGASATSRDCGGSRAIDPSGAPDTRCVANQLIASSDRLGQLQAGHANDAVRAVARANPACAARDVPTESTGCGAADTSGGSSDSQSETRYEVRFSLGRPAVQKLHRVQAIRSNHTTLEDLFELLLEEYLERHDPKRRLERRDLRSERRRQKEERAAAVSGDHGTATPADAERDDPAPAAGVGTGRDPARSRESQDHRVRTRRSRHVPAPVRDLVFERDDGRCTFVGPEGKRCAATRHLQIDHVVPYCRGGTHEPHNLRLLCGRHNRSEARRLLGDVGVPQQRSLSAETPPRRSSADP